VEKALCKIVEFGGWEPPGGRLKRCESKWGCEAGSPENVPREDLSIERQRALSCFSTP
jgi:hypothetical protein